MGDIFWMIWLEESPKAGAEAAVVAEALQHYEKKHGRRPNRARLALTARADLITAVTAVVAKVEQGRNVLGKDIWFGYEQEAGVTTGAGVFGEGGAAAGI